ncbi:MAG: phosphate signaling complex protein PhoU [Isosphaeraceae bacterium]
MAASQSDEETTRINAGPARTVPARHALREQDALWSDFLGLAASVVNALEKSVQAICEGRFDLIDEVEDEEEFSDRREVMIEHECLRILALYEPLASDLRRMATILKVNRDWERIADLALRVARRARKLARISPRVAMPDPIKQMARDVLAQVRSCSQALEIQDVVAARAVIAGDSAIDGQYRAIRRELKARMGEHSEQIDALLLLLSAARNLERIADHAVGIAQTIIYLKEGVIIRHTPQTPPPSL